MSPHSELTLCLLRGQTPGLSVYLQALTDPQSVPEPGPGLPAWTQAATVQTAPQRRALIRRLMAGEVSEFINVFTPVYDILTQQRVSEYPARAADLASIALVYHASALIADLKPDTGLNSAALTQAVDDVTLAREAYAHAGVQGSDLRAMRRPLLGLAPGETGWKLTECIGPETPPSDHLLNEASRPTPFPERSLLRSLTRHWLLQFPEAASLRRAAQLHREKPRGRHDHRAAELITRWPREQIRPPGAGLFEHDVPLARKLIRALNRCQPGGPLPLEGGFPTVRIPWPADVPGNETALQGVITLWFTSQLRERCPQLLTNWGLPPSLWSLTADHPLAGALPNLVTADPAAPA